jgi:gliding motility-associated-like protein
MALLVSKIPVCDAGPDQYIDYGTSTTLSGSAEGGSGSYAYNWEPASQLNGSASEHPVTVALTGDAIFILQVTDLLTGCRSSDSVMIRVKQKENEEDCIVIHNVITPNGDGVNDTWIIDCIEDFPDNNVGIFNRWGDKVNAFENYDNANRVWKGTNFKGELLPDGTYFYVLKIKNEKAKAGWVLIRGGRN